MPSHCSASVPFVDGLVEEPTAMQAVPELHDTPDSELDVDPLGFGVDWIVQPVPLQRSANVPLFEVPTAVQAVAELHDTPDKELAVAPLGLGVCWIVHDVPSQRSASVS